MRSRAFVAVALTLVALFGSAGALLAYDASERNTIARGIKIGGIDVGGLSVAQAVGRVRSAYAARLSRPVVLRSGGGRFVLTPRAAHVSVDLEAKRAGGAGTQPGGQPVRPRITGASGWLFRT